jgi:hypothetical protein
VLRSATNTNREENIQKAGHKFVIGQTGRSVQDNGIFFSRHQEDQQRWNYASLNANNKKTKDG